MPNRKTRRLARRYSPFCATLPEAGESMMRDQILLLLSALACAIGAWAFWHYLDAGAVVGLMTLALVSSVADNLRLRRKLRETERRG